MKQRNVVVNFTKCSAKSTIASNRIAGFIAEQLGAPLIDTKAAAQHYLAVDGGKSTNAFFVNGMFQFCDFRDEAVQIAANAKRMYWCANDYAIQMPGKLKRLPHVRLATFDNFNDHPAHLYINWNQLTHGPTAKNPKEKKPGLIYWGAFREGRLPSFRRYIGGAVGKYPVTISTTPKNREKFSALNGNVEFFEGFLDPQVDPGRWQATLYIEDKESHENYHSPANRFYEALAAGTLILFCKSVVRTFNRAGIDIAPWLVGSADDVANALASHKELLAAQQQTLHLPINYKTLLTKQFRELMQSCDVT
jgi:hypothetical protein